MAKFIPVFLSLLLNLSGIYIFVDPRPAPKNVSCPLMSSIFFVFAVFVLILDMRLYSISFRRLHWIVTNLYQFVVASFILERLVDDLWFPLEVKVMLLPQLIGYYCEYIAKNFGGACLNKIAFILYKAETKMICSYGMSLLFLGSVFHATRIVDFRILNNCGFKVFMADTKKNLIYIRRRMLRKFHKYKKPRITCDRSHSHTL